MTETDQTNEQLLNELNQQLLTNNDRSNDTIERVSGEVVSKLEKWRRADEQAVYQQHMGDEE